MKKKISSMADNLILETVKDSSKKVELEKDKKKISTDWVKEQFLE